MLYSALSAARQRAPTSMTSAPRRLPLLIYARLFSLWRLPALLIAALLGLLWWQAPGPVAEAPLSAVVLIGSVAALALFVFTLVGPRLSYVQCQPTHLRVNTPFFRLAISYSRIHTTRPVPFNPAQVRWTQAALVQPFRGRTMVAVDLNRYPVSLRWLRLWLNEFMLPAEFLGLQFLVADWMGLSRDIEVHRGQWKTRDRDQARQDSLTSLTAPRRY